MTALAGIRVPQITQEEFYAFHESHFSLFSIADFRTKFTGLPGPASKEDGIDEPAEKGLDGFGPVLEPYDEGGIEVPLPVGAEPDADADADDYDPEASYDLFIANRDAPTDLSDGEVPQEEEALEDEKPRKKRRRKKNNGNGNGNGNGGGAKRSEVKPDLRKRTWDVVDTGLGSLDYDGLEQTPSAMPAPSQRRRVQYGDD